jgi:hypothetical protein
MKQAEDNVTNRELVCMSLRDWFAGMAMQAGILRRKDDCPVNMDYGEWLAGDAYWIADAMLKRREKKP